MERTKSHSRNSNENLISGIHDGNLFRESVQKSMEEDTHFTFHLPFTGDSVNLQKKTHILESF